MSPYLEQCPCGSGKEAQLEFDARGIELGFMCEDCREKRLSTYRSEVLTDPTYKTTEPIDPD